MNSAKIVRSCLEESGYHFGSVNSVVTLRIALTVYQVWNFARP